MDKQRTQGIINKIISNEFSIDDVELLFYRIRDNSTSDIIREIGDYIHSERSKV